MSKTFALEVAVVGAGASGLTAAHFLKKQGHTVTIFEKNDRVGGKVYSYKIDDTTIELGGLIVTKSFNTIYELAKEYGPLPKVFPSKVLFLDKKQQWKKFKGYSAVGPVKTFVQYKRLFKVFKQFPELSTPELISTIHPDLFLPLDQFAMKYRFYDVLPPFVMSMSASGYLFPEVTPAYYALKLFRVIAMSGIGGYIDSLNPFASPYIRGLRYFTDGYSSLWKNVAGNFDVRLNEEVTAIDKGLVTTTKGSYHFDKIIISTDLPTARSIVMRPSNELKTLSDKMVSHRFLISVIKTKDLKGSAHHSYFFYPNMTEGKINHVVSMVNFWNNDELYVTYQDLDNNISWDEARNILAADLKNTLNIKQFEIVKKVEWPYFHHIPKNGFTPEVAKALNTIQGQDGIYFVGESLNFESTESAAQNAKWIVRKYF